jgi:hypothetical protein
MYREENEMSSIWSGGRVSKMDDAGPRVEIKRDPREIERGNPSKPTVCNKGGEKGRRGSEAARGKGEREGHSGS